MTVLYVFIQTPPITARVLAETDAHLERSTQESLMEALLREGLVMEGPDGASSQASHQIESGHTIKPKGQRGRAVVLNLQCRAR